MKRLRTEKISACPVCGKFGRRIYSDLKDRLYDVQGTFSFQQCPSCGLLWLDPRPIKKDIPKCYETYCTHEAPREGPQAPRRPFAMVRDALRTAILCGAYRYRHLHATHILCRLSPLLVRFPWLEQKAIYGLRMPFPAYSLGLLIDIGCGNGSYLARMKDLGWKVLGIEPDPASAQIAKNKGIPVFSGSLEEAHLPEAIADYITMTHVIEHLPDPRSTLRECYRLLKPGGKVVVFTPNVDSLGHRLFRQAWMALDPPRHLMIFSVLSIDKLFRTVFSRVDVGTSSHFAREHYDASAVISQSGRVNLHRVRPQRGGLLFAVKERLSCRLWNTGGEELKVVAVK